MTTYNTNAPWGPMAGLSLLGGALGAFSLDDADNSLFTAFSVPQAGNLEKVGVCVTTLTGNPPAYNVSLVTIDANGDPTTTNYGGCSTETYDFTTAGWHWVTLGTAAAGTAGDVVAARIWPAGTPDVSNYVAIGYAGLSPSSLRVPHVATYTSGWLTPISAIGPAAIYAGGTVALPALTDVVSEYNADTTPDEVGVLFSAPFDCVCNGATWSIYPELGASSSFTVKLYNSADTLLASAVVNVAQLDMGVTSYILSCHWDGVSLTANASYRLTVLATSAYDVRLACAVCNEAASRAWWPEGERFQYTARTDGGAWTESTTKLPMLSPLLSSYSIESGSTPGTGSSAHSAGLLVG